MGTTKYIVILLLGMIMGGLTAEAAPKSKLWERWLNHNNNTGRHVDHTSWDKFLRTYLKIDSDGISRIPYARVTSADRAVLNDYIASLEQTPVDELNRDQQMAYWLNLYNAVTVKVILDHYPVKSIRDIDISPGFFSNGPWQKKLVSVAGIELSLDDIEHRILRPIWKDPRIHYGVNCASVGCPNLQPEAFTAENLESMLTTGAVEFVNHPRGARMEGERLKVSSIYHWFKEDFEGNDKGVIRHLMQYANPELKTALEAITQIDDHAYEWSLNDIR